MRVSIIITTKNRAKDLAQTLAALNGVRVPEGLQAELLVVDNNSNDTTAEVVRGCTLRNLPCRYVHEPRGGQSQARNRGLSETSGEMVLFTDDDVRPSVDWLGGMCQPMAEGKASVVAGGVTLAPHLLRPWMTLSHRSWLASSEWLNPETPQNMVGANMGFAREVLQKVPAFDPELGPGASGFGDDELFAYQLLQAGYQICSRVHVTVEHHFDPSRLKRASWVDAAARRGRTNAYITYHWRHLGYKLPIVRWGLARCRLIAWRSRPGRVLSPEGCSEEELRLVHWEAELQEYLKQRHRKRCYASRHALVKGAEIHSAREPVVVPAAPVRIPELRAGGE